MDRYKEKWVKTWSVRTIIGQAVSLGIEFMAKQENGDLENLAYNERLLRKEL